MLLKTGAAAALMVFFSGCAPIKVAPVEPGVATPNPASGYVAGSFTREKMSDLAFVVHDMDTGVDYNLPLGADSRYPTAVNDQVIAIAVPPGHYAINQWVAYATITKDVLIRKDVSIRRLSAPFTVLAGDVIFLGKYLITGGATYGGLSWHIQPMEINVAEAQRAFVAAYPAFLNSRFNCRLCFGIDVRAKHKQIPYGFMLRGRQ